MQKRAVINLLLSQTFSIMQCNNVTIQPSVVNKVHLLPFTPNAPPYAHTEQYFKAVEIRRHCQAL